MENENLARFAASFNEGSLRNYLVVLSGVVLQHQLAISLGSNLSGSSDNHDYVWIGVMVILEKCVTVLSATLALSVEIHFDNLL